MKVNSQCSDAPALSQLFRMLTTTVPSSIFLKTQFLLAEE